MENSYSEIINRMKEISGSATDTALADLLGVQRSSISAYKNRGVPKDKLIIFSQKYNVDLAWLESGQENGSAVQPLEQTNDNDLVRLEVLDVQVSAGNGTMLDGELMPVTLAIEYAKSALGSGALPYLEKEHIKITNIRGDSMAPTIESGDLLFVDISQPYFNGDGIYVFNYNGFNHVKRLQHAGNCLLVLSDNPQYKTWEIRLDNEELFHVAGRVVFVSGKIRGV